jgi:hypothetical protein
MGVRHTEVGVRHTTRDDREGGLDFFRVFCMPRSKALGAMDRAMMAL